MILLIIDPFPAALQPSTTISTGIPNSRHFLCRYPNSSPNSSIFRFRAFFGFSVSSTNKSKDQNKNKWKCDAKNHRRRATQNSFQAAFCYSEHRSYLTVICRHRNELVNSNCVWQLSLWHAYHCFYFFNLLHH